MAWLKNTRPAFRRETDWPAILEAIHHRPDDVSAKGQQIYQGVLARSNWIREGNFTSIRTSDLHLLFGLYDDLFFARSLSRMFQEKGIAPVGFRLSDRMTRAGGKTELRRTRILTAKGMGYRSEYEIAISTFLLFQTFREPGRRVTVSGLPCRDRLEALQRIFEHELLHLAEFLAWGNSSCAGPRFDRLSRAIFAHEDVRHDLVTVHEVAARNYQIRVGEMVRFEHDGVVHVGRVNRITKRATVLVQDATGRLYSDGGCYTTFYVPIPRLIRVEGSTVQAVPELPESQST